MSEKTRHEILEEVYHNANNQLFFVPMKLGAIAMQAYADQQLKKPNEFIRDVAKLLGEDGLGFDGLSWTVEDFKNAIDQEKRSTAIAFAEWMDGRYKKQGFFANDDRWYPANEKGFDTRLLKTSDELYRQFEKHINSL